MTKKIIILGYPANGVVCSPAAIFDSPLHRQPTRHRCPLLARTQGRGDCG